MAILNCRDETKYSVFQDFPSNEERRDYSPVINERLFPLPNLGNRIYKHSPSEILKEQIRYVEEHLYFTLPNIDQLSLKQKEKIIDDFYKAKENLERKQAKDPFREAVKEYELRITQNQRQIQNLKVPAIIKNENRINELNTMRDIIQKNMKEKDLPVALNTKVDCTMKKVLREIRLGRKRCTRDIWRSIKMIKLGTEKEKTNDAILMATSGHLKLLEALKNEPKVISHEDE